MLNDTYLLPSPIEPRSSIHAHRRRRRRRIVVFVVFVIRRRGVVVVDVVRVMVGVVVVVVFENKYTKGNVSNHEHLQFNHSINRHQHIKRHVPRAMLNDTSLIAERAEAASAQRRRRRGRRHHHDVVWSREGSGWGLVWLWW